MHFESHEKARLLIDRVTLEGVSPDEQRWLDSHLEGCAECGRYAELSERTVRALGSFAFEVDPAAASRVQVAVRSRVASSGGNRRAFSIGILTACFLTIAGSLAMWMVAGWLAGRWELPARTWQTGFAVFWLLPSIVLDVLILFRREGERI